MSESGTTVNAQPQALGLFGKLTAQINLHFLMAYPTAQGAQALTRAAFEVFCREHRYGRADLISRRYAHLMEPAPEANPIAVAAYRDQIRILAELLLPQVLRRTEALSCLAQLFSQHPDAFILDSLPGDGERVEVRAGAQSVRLLFVSGKPPYEPIARYGPFVMNTAEEIGQALRDFFLQDGAQTRKAIHPWIPAPR